jgi:putative toxin-antitoxin system antitoxin component (TIGR02293 family)
MLAHMSAAALIEPEAIANIMGGEPVLKASVHSMLDLHRVILGGVPKAAVTHLGRLYADVMPSQDFAALFTSASTMKRPGPLSLAAGERVQRVARLTALAERAFDSRDKGVAWLTTAHPMLGRATPLELARTEIGARQVERLLANILFDLPA